MQNKTKKPQLEWRCEQNTWNTERVRVSEKNWEEVTGPGAEQCFARPAGVGGQREGQAVCGERRTLGTKAARWGREWCVLGLSEFQSGQSTECMGERAARERLERWSVVRPQRPLCEISLRDLDCICGSGSQWSSDSGAVVRRAGLSNQEKAKKGEVGRTLQMAISPYGQAWGWPPTWASQKECLFSWWTLGVSYLLVIVLYKKPCLK